MKVKNKKFKSKKILIALLAIMLAVGGAAYYFAEKDNSVKEVSGPEQGPDSINFDPPTNEELQQKEENKKEVAAKETAGAGTTKPPSSVKASPIITSHGVYDGQVEVGSRVPGVFEQSGTCTLQLSKGGTTKTKSQRAVQNVSEMSCGFISIPVNQLSQGSWTAIIKYSSNKYNGQSTPVQIRI